MKQNSTQFAKLQFLIISGLKLKSSKTKSAYEIEFIKVALFCIP